LDYSEHNKRKPRVPVNIRTPAHMWTAFAESTPQAEAFTQHVMSCAECRPMRCVYCADGMRLRQAYHEQLNTLIERGKNNG
jgi:hypothetical protein